MKIFVYDTYEEMSRAAADTVAAQLILKPDSHISLTAGVTPVGMFAELVKLHQERGLSFSQAWFYNLEERYGMDPHDERTLYHFLHEHLLDHVDADPAHLLLGDSLAPDIERACADYEALFERLPDGRLDMQVMGIGADAHIGMNRPNEALIAACHPVTNAAGPNIAMGVRSIMLAKRVVMLANGESKAQAIADMCGGKITTTAPATLLQLHPDVSVFLDRAAASKI